MKETECRTCVTIEQLKELKPCESEYRYLLKGLRQDGCRVDDAATVTFKQVLNICGVDALDWLDAAVNGNDSRLFELVNAIAESDPIYTGPQVWVVPTDEAWHLALAKLEEELNDGRTND